ncbi:MAG: aspartate--tRNA(Asn) ligase [Parcubacteria group bacterium CG_4_10_14_0_2_um_filter_7_35_8]|nr:MAG: aspartate--tRNA(Asn) ligase [Parcubacteria group bacterium CG23_combo_of_CG06-09_8_20_14_all_35_6]PIZ76639.1 MAG: aspartate--tRNA(Asn) ligase [Parcubacteria group bacterium CG_4_10_14_0_2_um_filter_7_35_8]
MQRTIVKEIPEHKGEIIKVCGFVNIKRDHGKLVFIDLIDRSGVVQIVGGEKLSSLKPQDVIEVTGKVQERPVNMVNKKILTGSVELSIETIEILSKAEEIPFDMTQEILNVELPTLLDFRALTLRHSKVKSIFKVQAAVMQGFRNAAQALDCVELFVPTISASATEGGAEVFKIDYYGHNAYMVQSPQLYKQMLVPVFERVFVISHAYRAEPSVTTRHLSESVQMDCEFGFVNFDDLLDYLELVGKETLKYVGKTCSDILSDFNIPEIKIPENVPRLTMREAQRIILERTGIDHTKEKDLEPEDEREICKWALETHNSDLVTITHYPTKKRAFYTLADPKDPEFSLSYDLLFRGIEILSGSQRISNYKDLVSAIKERDLDPKNFEMYLQAFKYGMPLEGGFSFGLERITMQILQLKNIREASLFPRDMERVDQRLSVLKSNNKK